MWRAASWRAGQTLFSKGSWQSPELLRPEHRRWPFYCSSTRVSTGPQNTGFHILEVRTMKHKIQWNWRRPTQILPLRSSLPIRGQATVPASANVSARKAFAISHETPHLCSTFRVKTIPLLSRPSKAMCFSLMPTSTLSRGFSRSCSVWTMKAGQTSCLLAPAGSAISQLLYASGSNSCLPWSSLDFTNKKVYTDILYVLCGQRKQIIQFNVFFLNELSLKVERFHIIEIESGNSEHFSWRASAGTESPLSPRDVLGFPGHLHFHHSVLMFVSCQWIFLAAEKCFSTPRILTNVKIYHLDQQGFTFPEKWTQSFSSWEQRAFLCMECASTTCLVWKRHVS